MKTIQIDTETLNELQTKAMLYDDSEKMEKLSKKDGRWFAITIILIIVYTVFIHYCAIKYMIT